MKQYIQQKFTGERALFGTNGADIRLCTFLDGESPLKESSNLDIRESGFRWKYPLWYCRNVTVADCTWFDMARAGVWYSDNLAVVNSLIQAPKNFRRCDNLSLDNVTFTNAQETLWHCTNVRLNNVSVTKGDYFAMNSTDMDIDGLTLDGNYSFDGAKNVTITNSRLLSKDAFWNTENVTVRDSFITGEYLGWNSKNLTLINCVVASEQGMCYCENLVMKDCTVVETNLAFEYSSVDADIKTTVDSILNPASGKISAEGIGQLIIEKDRIDADKTEILCDEIGERLSRPEWIKEN